MTMTAIMMIIVIKISLTMFDDNKGEDKVRKFMRFHCETSQVNDIGAFANSLLTSYVLSYRQLSPYLRFSRSQREQRVTNPKISVRPSLWNLLELFLTIISSVRNLFYPVTIVAPLLPPFPSLFLIVRENKVLSL